MQRNYQPTNQEYPNHMSNRKECEILDEISSGKVSDDAGSMPLYLLANNNIQITFTPEQERIWRSCLRRKWLLPYVDSILLIKNQLIPLEKILIMIAILETQPTYSSFFC